MQTTGDDGHCPFCGSDIIVVNQLMRCVGCDYISLIGYTCPDCGGDISVSKNYTSCSSCSYQQQYPAD